MNTARGMGESSESGTLRRCLSNSVSPLEDAGIAALVAGGGCRPFVAPRHTGEVILFAQAAVNPASDECSGRALHAAGIPAKQNDQRDFGLGFICVGNEPAQVRLVVGAGARLAQRKLIAALIETRFPRAIEHGGEHAFANRGKERSDIELALDARFKASAAVFRRGILEEVERAAIGHGGSERGELEWRHLDAFAEA